MGLTKAQNKQILEELENCTKPLYFFHDDPDGLCSFLQLYAHIKEGYGVVVKSRPIVDLKFLPKVTTYDPDKIIVVDIAMMEQEFADRAKRKIIWIDHHPPQEIHGVKYFNPRIDNPHENPCAAYLCYQVVQKSLWIAMVGCIGDMHWPTDLLDEFREKYPGLLPEEINDARTALYESQIGKMSRIFSAILKGTSTDAMKYVKALTRIKEPNEILKQENARGKYIYKRFKAIDREYQKLLKESENYVEDNSVIFKYADNKIAFSGDLANELTYRYPGRMIIVGREKSGEVKMSLRSEKHNIPKMINTALIDCEGYGGGHEHAAGACIKAEDFNRFIENLNLK